MFMEYDRGKMSYRDHCAKFRIYAGYIRKELYKRDYGGMPRILVMTTNDAAEARIGRAVLAVVASTFVPLPVLTTTSARARSPRNPDSLLGQIWRAPEQSVDTSNQRHGNAGATQRDHPAPFQKLIE